MRLNGSPAFVFLLLVSPTFARNANDPSISASTQRTRTVVDDKNIQRTTSSADQDANTPATDESWNSMHAEDPSGNRFTAKYSGGRKSATTASSREKITKLTNILKNGAIENNFAKDFEKNDDRGLQIAKGHSRQPEISEKRTGSEREFVQVSTIDNSRTSTPRSGTLGNATEIHSEPVNGTTIVYRETTFNPVLSESLLRSTEEANSGRNISYLPSSAWKKNNPDVLDVINVSQESNTQSDNLEPNDAEIAAAADYGLEAMNDLYYIKEPKLFSMGLFLTEDNPARYVAAFNAQSEEAKQLARFGFAALEGASEFLNKHPDLSRTESIVRDTRNTALHRRCPRRGIPPCPPASLRYRTTDGSCNNPRELWWGSAMSAMQRFLKPVYQDGIQTIRRSVNGRLLPSPREISATIHEDRDIPLASVTHMLMQWGQFIDHDMTATGQSRGFNGTMPQCCLNGGASFQPPDLMHPECLPIPVPSDDKFYGPIGVRCLEFARSGPVPPEECGFGPREQLSQVTSWLDASTVYSSNAQQSDNLRLFRNGLLQYGSIQSRKPLLPRQENDLCRRGSLETSCFRAGDGRLNEQPALISMHVVFLRQHNRIATHLAAINPHWSDEKLFQEARRIVGAIIQHITYREFLPIVLGPQVIRAFDIEIQTKGYYEGYDPTVNPNVANAFATAAYRFGHSLVQPSFVRYDTDHRPILNNVTIHNEFNNPVNLFTPGSLDRLLLGLVNQPSQKRDEFITDELTNHLFQTASSPFGMDLASINIQRGRDHGLAPYVDWREPCGLSLVKTWEDLERATSRAAATKFRRLYDSIEDIDLYPAGLAEKPVPGGLVGPTFACIIAQQFSNLRRGDRFWYENPNKENSFTLPQLQQIRKVTLAQVLCKTMDNVETIQPFVFITPDTLRNERTTCDDNVIGDLDLKFWQQGTDTSVRSKIQPKKGSKRNKTRRKGQKRQTTDLVKPNDEEEMSKSQTRGDDEVAKRSNDPEQRFFSFFGPPKHGINQQNKILIKRPENTKENLTILVQNNAVNSPVFFNDPISGSNFQFSNSANADHNPSTSGYGSTHKPTRKPPRKPTTQSTYTSQKPIYYDDSDNRPIYVSPKPQQSRPKPISHPYNNPSPPVYVPHTADDPNNPNPPSYGFVANPVNNRYPTNSFFESFSDDQFTTQKPTLYTFYTTFTPKRTTTQKPNSYRKPTRPQSDQTYYHYQEFDTSAKPSYVTSKPQASSWHVNDPVHELYEEDTSSRPQSPWTQRPLYDHSWISTSSYEQSSPNRPAHDDPDRWSSVPVYQSNGPSSSYDDSSSSHEKPSSYPRPGSTRPSYSQSSRPQYWTDYPTTTKKYSSTSYYYDAEYQIQNTEAHVNPRPFKTPSVTIVTDTDANVHHVSGYRMKPEKKGEVPKPLQYDRIDPVEHKHADGIEIVDVRRRPGQFYYNNNVLHRYPDKNATNGEESSSENAFHGAKHGSQSPRVPIDKKYQIEHPYADEATDHLTIDEHTKAHVATVEIKLTTTPTIVLDNDDEGTEVTVEDEEDAEDTIEYDDVDDDDDDEEDEDDDSDLAGAYSTGSVQTVKPDEAFTRRMEWTHELDNENPIESVELPNFASAESIASDEIPAPMKLRRPAL